MPRSNNKMLTTLLNIPKLKVVGNTKAHLKELILTTEAEKKEAICPRCRENASKFWTAFPVSVLKFAKYKCLET